MVTETNEPPSRGGWVGCRPGLGIKTGKARVDGYAGAVAMTAVLRDAFYRRFAPVGSPRADRICRCGRGAHEASAFPGNITFTFGPQTAAAVAAPAEWVLIGAGWRESNLDAVQRRAHSADAKPGREWRHRC